MRYVLALLALIFSLPAYSQIYQYVDPETGSNKITNIAPPWYSRTEKTQGPRTLVIVRGAVVHDTRAPSNPSAIQDAIERAEALSAEDERLHSARRAAQAAATAAAAERAKQEKTQADGKAAWDGFGRWTQDMNQRRRQAIQEWSANPIK